MCLFCLAVFTVLAGAVTGAVVNKLEHQLASVASNKQVKRMSDTGSTAVFTLDVPVPTVPGQAAPAGAAAPVRVTVYKGEKRVRIQITEHFATGPQGEKIEITGAQAEAIEDLIAQACGLTVVERSSAQTRHMVRQALDELIPSPPASGTAYEPPAAQPDA